MRRGSNACVSAVYFVIKQKIRSISLTNLLEFDARLRLYYGCFSDCGLKGALPLKIPKRDDLNKSVAVRTDRNPCRNFAPKMEWMDRQHEQAAGK